MRFFFQSVFLFQAIASTGQGFLQMDTLGRLPDELKELTKGTFKRALKVDFNGDGKADFICEMMPDQVGKEMSVEYWITSDLQLFKEKPKYGQDYDYFWFINLDDDNEPEIFSANGYEDGIDYAVYDQNLKTGDEILVSYVNPVIIEGGRLYWGYPWDIRDLITRQEGSYIYLKASLDHEIERDGEITIPDPSRKFPAVFFYGHSTQPNIKVGQIRNIKWLSLKELR